MTQYSYKILRADGHQMTEEQLNRLGLEGWGLEAVLKAEDKPGTYLYYFVREAEKS